MIKPFYSVSLSRWEGITIPHQPIQSLGNPKARATTYDLQGLFIRKSTAIKFVRRLIEVDTTRSKEHYVGEVQFAQVDTDKATYFIVRQGNRPIGIYRVIRIGFGPWAFQHQGDDQLYAEVKAMGWLV